MPEEGKTGIVRHPCVVGKADGVVVQHAVVGKHCVEAHEGRRVGEDIAHNELGAVAAGAVVEGKDRLRQRLLKRGQHGVTACACGVHVGDVAAVGAGIYLAGDKAEVGVVGAHGTKAVGAGGIGHAAEIDRVSGVGGVDILGGAVADHCPAVGHPGAGHVGADALVADIAGEVVAVRQRQGVANHGVGCDLRHRYGGWCCGPSLLHIIAALEVPAVGGVKVAILEDIAVVQCAGCTGIGADAVEVGPPEVVAHGGVDGR